MQTSRRIGRRRQRGFTWLLVLFITAVSAAAMGALAEHVDVEVQREREAELVFRGGEIVRAITTFAAVKVDGRSRLPQTLDELLEDRRARDPVHHLRRAYADPFTGRADWVLLRDAGGGITGVRSRSTRIALRQAGVSVAAAREPAPADERAARPVRVSDWVFAVDAPASPASSPQP